MGGTCCGNHEQTYNLRVMTLNWGGIPNGPFEYYISDYEPQSKVLGKIFEQMCENELQGFKGEKELRNLFGIVEKQFKKGRYSPLFNKMAGVKETGNPYDPYISMSEKEFKKIWNRQYQKNKEHIEKKLKEEDLDKLEKWKQNLKQYDFIAYKAILRYVYPADWHSYLKEGKSLEKYMRVVEPFFEFPFLDEDNKVSHFRYGYRKTNSHLFFIQSYSKNLIHFLEEKATVNFFWHKNHKKKMLTIFKKDVFKSEQRQFKEMELQKIFSDDNINNYQMRDDNSYDKIMALQSPHFIIMNIQFTSSRIKSNQMQREYLYNLMEFFNRTEPYSHKTVIVGGDINQFENKFPPFCSFFPTKPDQVTTFKKRTALQSQRKKKDVRVKLSRDKIITNRKMIGHKIVKIDGQEPDYSTEVDKDEATDYEKKQNGQGLKSKLKTLLPDDTHPFDQFCVKAEIQIPAEGLIISKESSDLVPAE